MLAMSKGMKRSICFAAAAIWVTTAPCQGEISHRVRAIVMNRESSLHTSVGNRDVYILRVTPRRGSAFDAIAVDSYPGYAEALPLRRLTKDVIFSLKLVRTPYCDRPATANVQDPDMRCFAIDHGSLKLPKSTESDLWWK
jgi:hypothetical protein